MSESYTERFCIEKISEPFPHIAPQNYVVSKIFSCVGEWRDGQDVVPMNAL
jgi:hypothetical protein